MIFEQTEFDFGDNICSDLYDSVGKTIGISCSPISVNYNPNSNSYNYNSTTYNVNTGSGAISGSIGTTGPTLWQHGATGATGSTYTIGSSAYPTITFNDNNWYTNGNSGLDVRGDANFEGDLKIKGKSLNDTLDRIEQRLALLTANSELEEKWDQLKELGNKYRELEKEILEKQKMWDILKK